MFGDFTHPKTPAPKNSALAPFGPKPPSAPAPGMGRGDAYAPKLPPPPAQYGSQSGPGILESWFNQRANGTDPAYEYALKRGGDDLDSRMSAGGSFNSGARGQQLSDFYANSGAQRMGQLDSLAGGASGEHQNRVNSSMMQGLQLAGGQAGLASAYDLGAAGNMQAASNAQQQMYLNKAGVDQQANQGLINNGFSALKMFYGGGAGGTGGK